MIKTEFLLTILIQYQADKWWEWWKISIRRSVCDSIPNSLELGGEILGAKGLRHFSELKLSKMWGRQYGEYEVYILAVKG